MMGAMCAIAALEAEPSDSEHPDFLARRIEAEGWGSITKPQLPESAPLDAALLDPLEAARQEIVTTPEKTDKALAVRTQDVPVLPTPSAEALPNADARYGTQAAAPVARTPPAEPPPPPPRPAIAQDAPAARTSPAEASPSATLFSRTPQPESPSTAARPAITQEASVARTFPPEPPPPPPPRPVRTQEMPPVEAPPSVARPVITQNAPGSWLTEAPPVTEMAYTVIPTSVSVPETAPADPWMLDSRRPAISPPSTSERSLPTRPLRQREYARPSFPETVAGQQYNQIAGINQPLTQRYITQYSTPEGVAWLVSMAKRGESYLSFIWKEIYVRNLPHELRYLPLIESAYQPTAISRAGAAGLWQFMTNSMAPYDMKVSEWMDERMDFWKSTIGALRKLDENYHELGDWPLALAAYNAGLGGVSRTVKRVGVPDYWILSDRKQLASETINYVPKLLAFSYILSNLRAYGVDPLWPADPEWTRLRVGRTVDLEMLAKEASVDHAVLKQANRELVYNVTPPDTDYYLKVRKADAAAISAVLARKDLTLVHYYIHTIRSGDTISELAKHYGISTNHILSANPTVQARYLKIGTNILIPACKGTTAPPPRQSTTASTTVRTHKVVKGESLWGIARRYNIDPESLARANNMRLNDILSIGKNLKIPR
ncbi:MAG: LysM peptidoglycan-binding domain-containing protein [Treponema sp.]|nr:LysM peptidoglycan-binding domain-containing protein [Treponema sp.]